MAQSHGSCSLTARHHSIRSDSSHQEAESLEDLQKPEKARMKKFIKTKFNANRLASDANSSEDETYENNGETYENN